MNKSIIMSPAEAVWKCIPESSWKEHLRCAGHNLVSPRKVGFAYSSGKFRTAVDGTEIRTRDRPYYLPESIRSYRNYPPRGATIIDAGAFVGHLSLYYAALVGSDGCVFAVEPDRQNRRQLNENLLLNPDLGNIHVLPFAFWDTISEIEFHESGVGSSAFWRAPEARTVSVATLTIDALVARYGLKRLDFIKMDIEGAELTAIRGAATAIQRFRPVFAVASYHVVNGTQTYPEVEKLLSTMGYRVETVWAAKECITHAW